MRTIKKDEESNGDEHVHDPDVLLKGRRVIGGARGGREMDFVRRVSVHLVIIAEYSRSSGGTSQNSSAS